MNVSLSALSINNSGSFDCALRTVNPRVHRVFQNFVKIGGSRQIKFWHWKWPVGNRTYVTITMIPINVIRSRPFTCLEIHFKCGFRFVSSTRQNLLWWDPPIFTKFWKPLYLGIFFQRKVLELTRSWQISLVILVWTLCRFFLKHQKALELFCHFLAKI